MEEEYGSAIWMRDHALQTHSFNWKHDVSDDNVMQGTFKQEHLKSIKIIPCLYSCKNIMSISHREHLQDPAQLWTISVPAMGKR